MAGAKCRIDTWGTAFGAVVIIIVGNDVGEGADLGIFELGQICCNVVVEVDLDVSVFGFVGVASSRAVIPKGG